VEITELHAEVKEYGKNSNLKDSDEASAKGRYSILDDRCEPGVTPVNDEVLQLWQDWPHRQSLPVCLLNLPIYQA
jgi:hypothetical protein